jgi:hypothetical protein
VGGGRLFGDRGRNVRAESTAGALDPVLGKKLIPGGKLAVPQEVSDPFEAASST